MEGWQKKLAQEKKTMEVGKRGRRSVVNREKAALYDSVLDGIKRRREADVDLEREFKKRHREVAEDPEREDSKMRAAPNRPEKRGPLQPRQYDRLFGTG